jgi:hypothetical protein
MALQGSDNLAIQRGGTMYRIIASDILDYILANIGSSQYEVADIAARNALTGMTIGDRVFVVDASTDATVDAGWAIYTWRGAAWTKVAEEEGLDVVAGGANLAYTAAPTQGTVVSSSGADAIIPAADGTNAGLMVPAQVTKLGHLTATAATDLDAMRTASHAAATLAGTTNTNPLTISGQVLGFSISQLALAP